MLLENSVILDIEGTGGTPQKAKIIEVGLIIFEKQKEKYQWDSLVNPEKSIPPFIQRHTGIKQSMVLTAPNFKAISSRLWDLLQGRLLVAHNVRADYHYLQSEFDDIKLDYQTNFLCSLKLSQTLYPEFKKHGIDSVIERLNINCLSRHRALTDAKIVCLLLKKMIKDFSSDYLEATVASLISSNLLINKK